MSPSTERQLKSFSGAILELYQTASLDTLSQDFVTAVSSVIKADRYSVNWLATRRDRLAPIPGGEEELHVRNWFRYPEYPPEADIEVFNRYMHQHPLFRHWAKHGPSSAKWSDFLTFRELREKAIYREYFRHVQVKYQLGTVSLNRTNGEVGVACNRNGCDFTESEKILLGMMTPHFEQALKLAIGRAALRRLHSLESVAANIGAAMIVTDTGAVLFRNHKAEALCEKFFSKQTGTPIEIVQWLSETPRRALSTTRGEDMLIIECEVAQRADLVAADLPEEFGNGRTIYLLRLAERSNAPLEIALKSLGLTAREAEVLSWMAQGKRNVEIAVILGMRASTVAKHAEHIFGKLGVENRTAAIARAWETLGT